VPELESKNPVLERGVKENDRPGKLDLADEDSALDLSVKNRGREGGALGTDHEMFSFEGNVDIGLCDSRKCDEEKEMTPLVDQVKKGLQHQSSLSLGSPSREKVTRTREPGQGTDTEGPLIT
jgi:hypothetical protein